MGRSLTAPSAIVILALLAAWAPCIASGERRNGPFGPPRFFGGLHHQKSLCRPSSSRPVVAGRRSSALSIPRGGGGGGFFGDHFPLFGRRRRKSRGNGDGDTGDDGGGGDDDRTLYPPLTRDEIVEKLNLPAYCVTDSEGTGIAVMGEKGSALKADGVTSNGGYVYLFLSRAMANEALRLAMAANEHLDGLKVTALHLGKVWFRLLHNDDVTVSMKHPENAAVVGPEPSRRVRFRLVPGARDLVGARVLLGLSPQDAEELRIALEPSPTDDTVPSDAEGARSIIERATHNSPAFKTPFDEVPVFLMPRMRVRRPEDGEDEQPKLPLFLSSRNMVKTFLDMARENPQIMSFGNDNGEVGRDQPVVQLVELNRIVEMMQEESEMDFRNVVILPPVEDEDDGGPGEEDDSDDDSDDGGGGDHGVLSAEPDYDAAEFAPFVSMEVSVFGEGQELVPMQ